MGIFTDLFNTAEISLPCADKGFGELWLEAAVQHLLQACTKV